MLRDLARENTHVALNALTEIAEQGQSEFARINAANAILERGHGKSSPDTQVNVQVNNSITLSESDEQILAFYRKKVMKEIELEKIDAKQK